MHIHMNVIILLSLVYITYFMTHRDQAKVAKVDLSSLEKYKNLNKQELDETELGLQKQIEELTTDLESMQVILLCSLSESYG